MRTRIPAGIDLEDRLLYGLSPARLGYVIGLLVIAAWFWRQHLWSPLRVLPGLLLLGAAATIGWWRHEGRHLDAWAEDAGRHLLASYRVEVDWDGLTRRWAEVLARLRRSPP
ncbi:MAG TPA: hypothetical protein VNG93_04410 [Candidatus Dormibacteraeota bacterium]|nr:hypothetical protein [Candidatus Dormibacteraeota bacterium]